MLPLTTENLTTDKITAKTIRMTSTEKNNRTD